MGCARRFRNPRLEAEAGNGGNALEERRWAWEFDPKPSRNSVHEREHVASRRALAVHAVNETEPSSRT